LIVWMLSLCQSDVFNSGDAIQEQHWLFSTREAAEETLRRIMAFRPIDGQRHLAIDSQDAIQPVWDASWEITEHEVSGQSVPVVRVRDRVRKGF
jgi:hypothetical protein